MKRNFDDSTSYPPVMSTFSDFIHRFTLLQIITASTKDHFIKDCFLLKVLEMSVGEPCAKEEYIASGGSTRSSQISNLERNIALYIQRARDYLNWWDGESAVFWAEKAVALSIDHHNLSTNHDKIMPFKNGTLFYFQSQK